MPHVLLRVGNIRGNFLMNPEIRLSYMQRLVTSEGEVGFKVNTVGNERTLPLYVPAISQ